MPEDGVTLKEHIESKLSELDQRIEQARVSMEKRLDGMNEFRDTLRDQAARLATKEEINVRFDLASKQIFDLQIDRALLAGKANQSTALIGVAFSVVAVGGMLCGSSIAIAGLLISIYNTFIK